MRVAVIIPTTEGPAPIWKLTRLSQAPRSVMLTQDDYRPLQPSARYHAFIQPGSPLAARIGMSSSQYEMRLGAKIETGRSWELPTALAHWLLTQGDQLDHEHPDLVIWATGALDIDLRVLPEDYHLLAKLERSAAALITWFDRAVPVLVLLPDSVAPPHSLEHDRMTYHKVANLDESISAINAFRPQQRDNGLITSEPSPWLKKRLFLGGTAGLALIALLGLVMDPVMINRLPSIKETSTPAVADNGGASSNGISETTAAEARNSISLPSIQSTELPPVLPRTSTPQDSSSDMTKKPSLILKSENFPNLILNYAPNGGSCRTVIFGETSPERQVQTALRGVFRSVVNNELCGFGFTLPKGSSKAVNITLPTSLIDLIILSDRQENVHVEPGDEPSFRLRAKVPEVIDSVLTVTIPGEQPAQLQILIERAP
jgi:hypothetical protein